MQSYYAEHGVVLPRETRLLNPFLAPTDPGESCLNSIPAEVREFVASRQPLIIGGAWSIVFYRGIDLYGVDMCVDLVAKLKRKYLRVGLLFALADIGDQSYFREIQRRIKDLDLEDNFHFMTHQQELWPLFRLADLMVRPTYSDGFGLSVAEALHVGCPAVASDACIRAPGAVTFRSRNAEDFLRKCEQILEASTLAGYASTCEISLHACAERLRPMAKHREPNVSVVIPSYNHARFVEKCLRSVIDQKLAPAELIVIDDGSIDDSPAIVERVLKECPVPCELIVRKHKGLCATLNEGLDNTRGKYFAYLGSDDVWLPAFLKERVRLLESRPDSVLGFGHCLIIDDTDRVIDCTDRWAHYVDGQAREMLLLPVAPFSPTVVYRRKALERQRWNEDISLEDYDLYLRLSMQGEFAFDPPPLAAWRRHRNNTSAQFDSMMNAWLETQKRVAPKLNISARELEKIQRGVRWRCAEDFSRLGQKRTASSLAVQNVGGAPSATSIARMLIRLIMPRWVMRIRQYFRRRHAEKRYGSIAEYMSNSVNLRN